MSASITVAYYRSDVDPTLQSFDLRLLVTSATDMPEEIFVFQHGVVPATSSGADASNRFNCVADPVDLEEFPADSPNLAEESPFYRLKEVVLRFRSLEELDRTKALLDGDIRKLLESLKAAETLALSETLTYD